MELTKEMILQELPGEQMDLWIIEHVLKWQKATYQESHQTRSVWSYHAHEWLVLGDEFVDFPGDFFVEEGQFFPSRNMEHALPVLETLPNNYALLREKTKWLICHVGSLGGVSKITSAETAPLVICRTALLLAIDNYYEGD